MKKTNKFYFCPKCKSVKVQKEMSMFTAVGFPSNWVCKNCGFTSYLFPTAEKIPKKK